MNIEKIRNLLPHRYPFALVDRVVSVDPGKRLLAYKNVTINEPFFQGHFPEKPVMPGVLIVEALAQATGLLAYESSEPTEGSIYYLVGVDKARFKQMVVPGDKLDLDVELVKTRRGIWVFECKALVDEKIVATAEVMCSPRDM